MIDERTGPLLTWLGVPAFPPPDVHEDWLGQPHPRWAFAAEVIRRVTYKPGWHLRLLLPPGDGWPMLAASFPVPDSNPPHPIQKVAHQQVLGPDAREACDARDKLGLLIAVRAALTAMEQHEADEWLKVDGRAPFHPHAART